MSERDHRRQAIRLNAATRYIIWAYEGVFPNPNRRKHAMHLGKLFGYPHTPPATPMEMAKPGEEIITAMVPKPFQLRVEENRAVNIAAGVQQMPVSIAEHWYSIANGVQIISRQPAPLS